MKHRRQLAAVFSAASIAVFASGSPIHNLSNTLIHANPALSVHKRTIIERESSVNPLQPTIRAMKFWRHVGPIVVHYKFTEFWYKIAHRNNHERRTEVWDKLHAKVCGFDTSLRLYVPIIQFIHTLWPISSTQLLKHAPTGLKVILELRGLYVKIGQVMSSRADFIPRQYVDAFSTVQDQVPPWEKERIERIITDSLRSCQDIDMHDVFESIGEVLGR